MGPAAPLASCPKLTTHNKPCVSNFGQDACAVRENIFFNSAKFKAHSFYLRAMKAPLLPGHFYHVYNRANGWEKLFMSRRNYLFFLRRFQKFIDPIAENYAHCLMPNHFHFLLRIREENEILKSCKKVPENISLYCSKQFSNFFSSYTQSFNRI